MTSILSVLKEPAVRNPTISNISGINLGHTFQQAVVQRTGGTRGTTQAYDALIKDTGLDMVLINDDMLQQAMANPAGFIQDRNAMLEGVLFEVLKLTKRVQDRLSAFFRDPNTNETLPASIVEDMARTVSRKVSRELIKDVDAISSGLNSKLAEKLINI